MCGIAGAIGVQEPGLIEAMTASLEHRGPDSAGHVQQKSYSLGARRLSIIDIDHGQQPFLNERGDKCIVFNGEIYNCPQLRSKLGGLGHHFVSLCDTEVVLRAYEEWGVDCVTHLRGMFAFAIGDGDSVFLARDRLGIKPLYYVHSQAEGWFLFASEIKALMPFKRLSLSIDNCAVGDMLVLGHLFGEATFFKDIRTLPPGSWMRLSCGMELSMEQRSYFTFHLDPDPSMGFEQAQTSLCSTLREAVSSHLVADVGVGTTLSGGLDSTLLTMIMYEGTNGKEYETFAIGDTPDAADLLVAKRVAQYLHSRHVECVPEFGDFLQAVPHCIRALESPTIAGALPLFVLCSKMNRTSKVVMNGEGSDEVFGGYAQYLDPAWRLAEMQRGAQRAKELQVPVSDTVREILERFSKAATFEERLAELFPLNLGDALVRHHLDVVDKCSMAFGIEMRVPFLDDNLVELVRHFPNRFKVDRDLAVGKLILKTAALKMFGTAIAGVVLRQKLMMPHASQNFFGRFARLCSDSLPHSYVKRHELNALAATSSGTAPGNLKRELLMIDLFQHIFVQNRGVIADDFDLLEFIRSRAN